MKTIACDRTRDRTVGADQPKGESKLLGNRQGEGMSAPGNQQDLYTVFMGLAQSLKICLRDVELRVEQSTVNVDGQKANGRSH